MKRTMLSIALGAALICHACSGSIGGEPRQRSTSVSEPSAAPNEGADAGRVPTWVYWTIGGIAAAAGLTAILIAVLADQAGKSAANAASNPNVP